MQTRREFLGNAPLTGMSLAALNLFKAAGASTLASAEPAATFNMSGYAAPVLSKVRIGLIGIGNRGTMAVHRLRAIAGLEFKALGDVRKERVEPALKQLDQGGGQPAAYTGSEEAWKAMCERDDIDLIYICTPWRWHAAMAVYAMEQGKHVAVEVPAAVTLEECWRLVETSERTRKHCQMLENCCYDFFELLTLNMARQGFFGEIIHGEGAYIHHHVLDEEFDRSYYTDMWRLKENAKRNGNLYPTHGLGPICQIMNINRGDRLDYLASVSSDDFTMGRMAEALAAKDPFFQSYAKADFRGNINTSIIRTLRGKTILLQHDVSSPGPYSRIHHLTGSKAVAIKWPLPARIAVGDNWASEVQMKQWENQYMPDLVRAMGKTAREVGGHGGMDFLMDWRLIDCLRHGLPLDHDVYDAAGWSAIAPLTEWSVANRSKPIDVPDFTRGRWRTNPRLNLSMKAAPVASA